MVLELLPQILAVSRFAPEAEIPAWALRSAFFTVSRTSEELSVVAEDALVPGEAKAERKFRALKVKGTLDFALTGVLASLAAPLAAAKISIFAVSTFDTDYILVRESSLEEAKHALTAAGFAFA